MYQAYVEKLREYEQWLERQQRRLDQAVQQSLQQQSLQQQQQQQRQKNGSEKVLGVVVVFSNCELTCAQFEFVSVQRVCPRSLCLGQRTETHKMLQKGVLLLY